MEIQRYLVVFTLVVVVSSCLYVACEDRLEAIIEIPRGTEQSVTRAGVILSPVPLPCAAEIFEKLTLTPMARDAASQHHLESIGAIFVPHYAGAPDRLRSIQNQLSTISNPSYYTTSFDRLDVSLSDWKCLVPDSLWDILSTGELAITIAEYAILYHMLVATSHEWILILEDDAILDSHFVEKYNSWIKEIVLNDAEIICLGALPPEAQVTFVNFPLYPVSEHVLRSGSGRTSLAYMISRSGAIKMLNFLPLTYVIDWQQNAAIKAHNIACYWFEPPIVVAGTGLGKFQSLLTPFQANRLARSSAVLWHFASQYVDRSVYKAFVELFDLQQSGASYDTPLTALVHTLIRWGMKQERLAYHEYIREVRFQVAVWDIDSLTVLGSKFRQMYGNQTPSLPLLVSAAEEMWRDYFKEQEQAEIQPTGDLPID